MRLLIMLHLLIISAYATILRVPSEFLSIQDGIYESQNGDTVLVAPGLYYEAINFVGKEILVASNFIDSGDESDITSTIIDASLTAGTESNSVVTFINNETIRSKLIGFTLTGGTGHYFGNTIDGALDYHGGGIIIVQANPVLEDLIITGNSAARTGGGIFLFESNADLQRLIIKNNSATYGAGISMHASASTLHESVIANNTAQINSAGIDVAYNSLAILDHLTVTRNEIVSGGYSAGLGLYESSTAFVSNCIFAENSPRQVDFVSFGSPNTASFEYCLVQGGEEEISEYGQTLNWNEGNIDGDPVFCDVWTGNFQLATNSPCIGAGSDSTHIGALAIGCSDFVLPEATLGHWNMEQTDDNSILDISGNGMDGSSHGGVWTEGLNGDALWLGANDYCWIPHHPYLVTEDVMTLEVICKIDSLDRNQVLLSRTGSDGFSLFINESNHLVGEVTRPSGLRTIEAVDLDLEADTWYHLALVVSNSLSLIYVNHSLASLLSNPGPIVYESASNLCIGGRMLNWEDGTLEEGFTGSIDEVRLSNVFLNPDGFLPLEPVTTRAEQVVPDGLTLQNYPNPFNPSTKIRIYLEVMGPKTLNIYNMKGQIIYSHVLPESYTGDYIHQWDGRDSEGKLVPSGGYLYQLVTDDRSVSQKMLLIR